MGDISRHLAAGLVGASNLAAHLVERRRQFPDFVGRLHPDFLLQFAAGHSVSGEGESAKRTCQGARQQHPHQERDQNRASCRHQ